MVQSVDWKPKRCYLVTWVMWDKIGIKIKSINQRCGENVESMDQIPGKQTLGSLNPEPHGPFFPTNREKKQF